MKKIIVDKVIRIIKSKGNLERELNVAIEIKGKEVSISGKPEEEYIAEKINHSKGTFFVGSLTMTGWASFPRASRISSAFKCVA